MENFILNEFLSQQEAAITYCKSVYREMVIRNVQDGINIIQSTYLFSRFEQYEYTIPGTDKTVKVDLFKLFETGAIPTLYYHLLRVQPDDMTQPYHFLTEERLNWLRQKFRDWLGHETAAYIESLP